MTAGNSPGRFCRICGEGAGVEEAGLSGSGNGGTPFYRDYRLVPRMILSMEIPKADFDRLGWQDVISACSCKDCQTYSTAFAERAGQAKAGNDEVAYAGYLLLTAVTALRLRSDSPHDPFLSLGFVAGLILPPPDTLTDNQLHILEELAQETLDPEMQARLSDLIWVRRKKFAFARTAVEAYLRAADTMATAGAENEAALRYGRAADLATALGRNAGMREKALGHLDALVTKGPTKLLLGHLLEVLLRHRPVDPKTYADIAGSAAAAATRENQWSFARWFSEIEAHYHFAASDETRGRAARVRAAEALVQEADEILVRSAAPSYVHLAQLLSQALEEMKRNGAAPNRQDEIHTRLLDAQERSSIEMQEVDHSFDATAEVMKARAAVEGQPLHDALLKLAFTPRLPRVDDLRTLTQEIIKGSIAHLIAQKTIVNERGRVVAPPPEWTQGRPEESDEVVRLEMHQHAKLARDIAAATAIEPMRSKINEEHAVRLADFMAFVAGNPFVPAGREIIFAQGLLAGQRGDFLVCGHLLIPQLENSIRHVLEQHGVVTTRLEDNGVQNEMDLNTILYKPEVEKIFGKDLAFDLKGLLVEHAGANLRNFMAHGLLDFQQFHTTQMSYLWWLTFRLCCIPIRRRRSPANVQEAQRATNDGAQSPDTNAGPAPAGASE